MGIIVHCQLSLQFKVNNQVFKPCLIWEQYLVEDDF